MNKIAFLFLIALMYWSCNHNNDEIIIDGDWYKPTPKTTFDWDLRSDIPSTTTYDAEVVDLDAFETDAALITQLHAQGKKVIAYLSVGSVEDWRDDAGFFPANVVGNEYPGWEGERFLDIGNYEAFASIMKARFDMIQEKGFDGIEPDNIDLNSWTTQELGFSISDNDVINYCKWLSNQAHERNLSIGQKNASDLAEDLVDRFDWILLEDAFFENFQEDAQIYIEKNKAVFAVEYTDNMSVSTFQNTVCPLAQTIQYTAILKNRDLDDYVEKCN